MLRAGNIRYELAQRDRAITCGGIGAMHLLAQHVGLPQASSSKLMSAMASPSPSLRALSIAALACAESSSGENASQTTICVSKRIKSDLPIPSRPTPG